MRSCQRIGESRASRRVPEPRVDRHDPQPRAAPSSGRSEAKDSCLRRDPEAKLSRNVESTAGCRVSVVAIKAERSVAVRADPDRVWQLLLSPAIWSLKARAFMFTVPGADQLRFWLGSTAAGLPHNGLYEVAEDHSRRSVTSGSRPRPVTTTAWPRGQPGAAPRKCTSRLPFTLRGCARTRSSWPRALACPGG